jgi:drug/metabolite transporter (DMT)-like permease
LAEVSVAENTTNHPTTIIIIAQRVLPIVLIACPCYLAVAIVYTSDFIFRIQTVEGAWTSLFYLFILSAFGTAFALILFNRLIQITTAVFASTVTYLIPITAVAWGIIDGEKLYPLHFVGMALIIVGVYVVNRFK